MSNAARLFESDRPTAMVSTKISCIYLFIVLGSRLDFVRLLPFALPYIMSTSWCSCILRISQTGYYFLCRLLIGYLKYKNFWSNDLSRLAESFFNGHLLWVYDGRQGLEMCALRLVVILMYHKCLATVVTGRKKRYVDTLKTENECENLFLFPLFLNIRRRIALFEDWNEFPLYKNM